jgi:8-oxo-dGTP pyrophosphatase MutT (NUDIX family)
VARLRAVTATSAGGIVIRHDRTCVARRREPPSRTGRLDVDPAKGHAEVRESREETALREVAEETGLEVRITGPLDSIEYSFVQSGQRIHKTVHYFLMEPIGGDLAGHDHEFEQVRWVTFAEAGSMLTFETERALVARAAHAVEVAPSEDAVVRSAEAAT